MGVDPSKEYNTAAENPYIFAGMRKALAEHRENVSASRK